MAGSARLSYNGGTGSLRSRFMSHRSGGSTMTTPKKTLPRNFKHGMAAQGKHGWLNRTYRIWVAMRTRCNNPNTAAYPKYGGRGIKVCPEWNDFSVFLRDMGEAPSGLSIDRIDNDGNYEKDNCRWATRLEQRLNQHKRVHCPQGHPYVLGDIDYRGRQFCRPCRVAHSHRRLARRKQKELGVKNV